MKVNSNGWPIDLTSQALGLPAGRIVVEIERAGVHQITFHELRHTFGTRMAAAGAPLRTLQHWLGHADSKTTQVYAHYQPSDQEADAADRALRDHERVHVRATLLP